MGVGKPRREKIDEKILIRLKFQKKKNPKDYPASNLKNAIESILAKIFGPSGAVPLIFGPKFLKPVFVPKTGVDLLGTVPYDG